MSCSGSGGGGSGSNTCICISRPVEYDRTLEFDPETGKPYETSEGRRRLRDVPMSDLRSADPSLDLNPDTGRPFEDDLEVSHLDPRALTYGKAEDYTITPPMGPTWIVTFRRYPTAKMVQV